MNLSKKSLIATAVVFVVMSIISFVIHQVIATADYAKMAGVFRPMTQINPAIISLATLISAFAFVQIYLKGQEDRPYLGEGVRFGLLAALFAIVPMYLVYYAVMPYQFSVTLKLIICETLGLVLTGIIAAFMLRK